MFGIGETELVIIVVFAFLLFGPDKLPGMGRTLGRVLRQFREASDGFTEVVQTNIMDPAAEELEKSPKQRKREAQQAQFAEDDDREVEEATEAPEPRRETFAERKARLKAEREAAAAADEAAEPEVADDGGDGDATLDYDVDSDDDLPEEEAAAEPKRPRASDLYALTQKSSRSQATVAEQEDVPAMPGEEDGSAEA